MRARSLPGLLALALLPCAALAPPSSATVAVDQHQHQHQHHAALAGELGSWTDAVVPAGVDPETIGVHTVLLHTGKVLVLGQNVLVPGTRATRAYLYDPRTGTGQPLATPHGANMECAGVAHLADGRVLLVGGHAVGNSGPTHNYLFDPVALTFTKQPDSAVGRYYPTVLRLPDGRVLVLGGKDADALFTPVNEVYTPPPAGSSVGRLARAGSPRGTGMYSRTWLMPDGKALVALYRTVAVVTPGSWSWSPLPAPSTTGVNAPTGTLLPGPATGSTRVLMTGGAKAATQVLDYADPTGWASAAPLPEPRTHMSPVLLPDGTLLGVGGNSSGTYDGGQLSTLRYDPRTNTWTRLASQHARRAYHSSAVLLPDGRVLSAGDNGTGGGRATVEVYSPPYLSAGTRPVIDAVPKRLVRGTPFRISTTSTTSRAVLMSPGAATHTLDMNARSVRLAVTRTSEGLTAKVPSRNVALNGWYMLFLVNSAGTPSVAKWVRVTD